MFKKRNATMKLIGLIAALVLLGLAGKADFEDEVMQQDVYCENVRAGIHSAYDKLIKCEDK